MPISNTTVTKAEFDSLTASITTQATKLANASDLALSGLNIVVGLDDTAPEVDLLNPFYNHYQGVDSLDSDSSFFQVVAALNQHVINRGTTAESGETPADRLNRWLDEIAVTTVSATYARISSGAGYIISNSNIA